MKFGGILTWKISFSAQAKKDFNKFDRDVQARIKKYMLSVIDDPRIKGKALVSQYRLWRYRVGNYRIICEINDQEMIILLVRIGHRKEIYKK